MSDSDGSRTQRTTRSALIGVGALLAVIVATGVVVVLWDDGVPAAADVDTVSDHVHAPGLDPSDAGEFVGVDTDGAIWFERAGSWVRTADLPEVPSALLAHGERLVAAMDDGGSVTLLESEDEGRSWTETATT